MKKRIVKIFSTVFSLSLPFSLISSSCVLIPNKTIKLNNSQIEGIKKDIEFKLTALGKQEYKNKNKYGELWKLLKDKNNEYVKANRLYELQFDKELSKYITLKFPNVNSLYSGHFLKITFNFNSKTQKINLHWHLGCSSYPNEGEGDIQLDDL